MTETSVKQTLILDFSGFLYTTRVANMITAKKQKYKLSGTISNYLKKLEYERVFDHMQFTKLFQYLTKSKEQPYDLILIENFPEMFLLYEDLKRLKGMVNSMLKRLAKYAFESNIAILSTIISHCPSGALQQLHTGRH